MSTALAAYLTRAYQGFLDDPPDTDYQRGYLAALLETGKQVNLQFTPVWRSARALINRDPTATEASPPAPAKITK